VLATGKSEEPARRSRFKPMRNGIPDSEVLKLAADAGRILVSADVKTMLVHFAEFIADNESPEPILIPSSRSFASIIEGAASHVVGLDAGPTHESDDMVAACMREE
jgi:hypothetical protein